MADVTRVSLAEHTSGVRAGRKRQIRKPQTVEQQVYYILAFVVASAAVYTDVKYGIVSNRLTFPTIALALGLHAFLGGWTGLGHAAQGAALGLGLLLIPFLLGGMGAGDVKLMAALGSLIGPGLVLNTFLFSAIMGGLVGILVIVRTYGWWGLFGTVMAGWKNLLSPSLNTTRMTGFPYATSIFFGLFLAIFLRQL